MRVALWCCSNACKVTRDAASIIGFHLVFACGLSWVKFLHFFSTFLEADEADASSYVYSCLRGDEGFDTGMVLPSA